LFSRNQYTLLKSEGVHRRSPYFMNEDRMKNWLHPAGFFAAIATIVLSASSAQAGFFPDNLSEVKTHAHPEANTLVRSTLYDDGLGGGGGLVQIIDCTTGSMISRNIGYQGIAPTDLATGTPERIETARRLCRDAGLKPGF
jgi:hypothetical protein